MMQKCEYPRDAHYDDAPRAFLHAIDKLPDARIEADGDAGRSRRASGDMISRLSSRANTRL